jgi:eukaryotic-like serine/threonine-protein kinase
VHRDLKPANIMVTRAGVKLLDFGLARLAASAQTDRGADAKESTHGLSTERTILGTLQYMSPEQLAGREADARTDIFAFGAVLYEMATGRKAFEGPNRVGLITAILEAEPKPILDLQPLSSPALDRLVRECLAKSPDDRWQTARDVMKHLKWITSVGSQLGATASPAARAGRSRLAVIAAATLLVGLALGLLLARRFVPAAGEQDHVRFEVSIPSIPFLPNLSISPDGRRIVFGARSPAGHIALFVRSLDSPQPRYLPGTEGVRGLFWSPDSPHRVFRERKTEADRSVRPPTAGRVR